LWQDLEQGINVCLTCFNGACNDPSAPEHNHQALHYDRTRHPLVVNVRRTPKVRPVDERPKKLTKLEILPEEPESERYDFHTKVYCQECSVDVPSDYGQVNPPPFHPLNSLFILFVCYCCSLS
jgi:ubiquitin carboxyl-terminal hydrolase 5/13